MKASSGVLKVFISAGCRGCRRALQLVEWVRRLKPGLSIQVIDLAITPDAGFGMIFAVPTYVYGNRPVFLGNPSRQELEAWLNTLGAEV